MSKSIKLHGKLDTAASQKLIEDLRTNRGANLVLDASEVSQFGTIAIQTIMVAAKSWKSDGFALSIDNLSDDATGQIESHGLSIAQIESAGSPT